MYKLYTWYAWEMGRWILKKESESVDELKQEVKGYDGYYKIVDNERKIVSHNVDKKPYCARLGMAKPRLEAKNCLW